MAAGAEGVRVVPVITGGVLPTITVLVPVTELPVAVTVPLAAVAGAVNRPLELTLPPVTVVTQVNVGWLESATPN